jgi:hypothetical protein
MIDKTMCEVLRRNIYDFYVNLRVEVAAVSRNRYGVEKTDSSTLYIDLAKDKRSKLMLLDNLQTITKQCFALPYSTW